MYSRNFKSSPSACSCKALVYNSYVFLFFFFSEQPFYGNYSTLDSNTNTVISHAVAYSSGWRRRKGRKRSMNSPRGVVQHFLRASFLPRGWLFSLTRSLWGTTLDCFGPFLMSDICDRTTRNGLFCLLQFVVDYVCIRDHAIENLDLRPGLEVLNSTKQPPGRSWFAAVCVFMCTVCVSFPSRCVAKIK